MEQIEAIKEYWNKIDKRFKKHFSEIQVSILWIRYHAKKWRDEHPFN